MFVELGEQLAAGSAKCRELEAKLRTAKDELESLNRELSRVQSDKDRLVDEKKELSKLLNKVMIIFEPSSALCELNGDSQR